jgi:Family of unknown function (DUF6088)
MKSRTLKNRVSIKISRSNRQVFIRADFEKLGEYDQVGRALRNLEKEGQLIRVGYGLYAKARPNRLTGNPMLAAEGGFEQVAREALKRLQVNYKPSDATQSYQSGSSQVPANTQFIVFDRFNRKIGTDKFQLKIIKHARA